MSLLTARAARQSIQSVLGVAPDGVIGSRTREQFGRLAESGDDAAWPPVVAPATAAAGLTDALRVEYQRLWETMVFRWDDDHEDEPGLEAIYEGLRAEFRGVVAAIRGNRERYEKIGRLAGGAIPWDFIAIIHNLECGLSFRKHLHNGDPLTARTVLVPAHRPVAGSPPFTFEASAVDALTMPGKEYHLVTDWSIPATLYRLEGYNGYGYRKYHPTVLSPYLWSGSNHYTRGKYVADGVWSDAAVSKQLGTALLLRALREPGV
jgi:lysozyme family protein